MSNDSESDHSSETETECVASAFSPGGQQQLLNYDLPWGESTSMTKRQAEHLVDLAIDYAMSKGALKRSPSHHFSTGFAAPEPFTLFPTRFPRAAYFRLLKITPLYMVN